MMIKKKNIENEKIMLERKIQTALPLKASIRPRKGWLRSIRQSLGISMQQLAKRVGGDAPSIYRAEIREAEGKITLELLEKIANGMDCQLVYAIVPKSENSLEEVLDRRAHEMAQDTFKRAAHSMRLEMQEVPDEITEAQIRELAKNLKQSLSPRLWDKK